VSAQTVQYHRQFAVPFNGVAVGVAYPDDQYHARYPRRSIGFLALRVLVVTLSL